MDGAPTYISLNLPNIITISLCGLIGYGILIGANMAYGRLTGGQAKAA